MNISHCLFPWWQIEVTNPDDTPAQGVEVVVNPGEVQGLTADNGYAKLTINTVAGNLGLKIEVSVWSFLIWIFALYTTQFVCKRKLKPASEHIFDFLLRLITIWLPSPNSAALCRFQIYIVCWFGSVAAVPNVTAVEISCNNQIMQL